MNPDSDDHAFVIQLYYDEGNRLRGHITHAYSRDRQALQKPEDVLVFLGPYLSAQGVRLGPGSRLVLWLCRLLGTPSASA